MRSKSEILQEWYGVKTAEEAQAIFMSADITTDYGILLSQCTRLKLPYEALVHPGIPSLEDIKREMKENYINRNVGSAAVCRVGRCAVKRGGREVIQEGEDMIFLKQHSQVRVPNVYAVFKDSSPGYEGHYLIYEFIESEELTYKMWKAMGDDSRERIGEGIGEQFNLLRSIPSEGYYGRVHNQGWTPDFVPLRTRFKELCGPYKTYEEFLSALNTSAEIRLSISDWNDDFTPQVPLWMDKLVPTLAAAKGREPVFTHLDPSLRNMLIRPLDGTMETAKDYEVTLIDWADSGWFPAWMQVVAFDRRLMLVDDEALKEGKMEFNEDGTVKLDLEPEDQLKAKIVHGFENSYEDEKQFVSDLCRDTYLTFF